MKLWQLSIVPTQTGSQTKGRTWHGIDFYHGLAPSLENALGFMMAELPEREQAGTSFGTLYMLAKKMEAH